MSDQLNYEPMGSRGAREGRGSGSNRYDDDQAADLDDINL